MGERMQWQLSKFCCCKEEGESMNEKMVLCAVVGGQSQSSMEGEAVILNPLKNGNDIS